MDLNETARGFHVRLGHDDRPQQALAHRLPAGGLEFVRDVFMLGLAPPTTGILANRITLPLWDGPSVVGFRCLTWSDNDPRPKVIPHPIPTPIHQPFGLNPTTVGRFTEHRFAVVTEGEVDCMTLWAVGIPAVACSTSYLAAHYAHDLAELVDAVVVWADFDEAGLAGREQTMTTLGSLAVQTVAMDRARPFDPNDYYKEHDADALRRVVSDTCVDAAFFPGGTPWSL